MTEALRELQKKIYDLTQLGVKLQEQLDEALRGFEGGEEGEGGEGESQGQFSLSPSLSPPAEYTLGNLTGIPPGQSGPPPSGDVKPPAPDPTQYTVGNLAGRKPGRAEK